MQATAAEASTAASYGRRGESKRLRDRSAQLRIAADALTEDGGFGGGLETGFKILGKLEEDLVNKAVSACSEHG